MLSLCRFVLLMLLSVAAFAQDTETEEEKKKKILEQNLKEAQVYIDDKKYEKAQEKYEAILEEWPQEVRAITGRMNTLGFQKRLKELVVIARSNKSANKKETQDSLIVEANGKLWLRNVEGARADLKRAVEMDPEKAYYAHYMQGQLYRTELKNDLAIKELERVIELNEEYAPAYYVLGDLFYEKGDTSKVIKYWSKYLELVPKEGERYKSVNESLSKLGGR